MPYALTIVFAAVARLLKVVPREPESAAWTLRFAACALWKPGIITKIFIWGSIQNIGISQFFAVFTKIDRFSQFFFIFNLL